HVGNLLAAVLREDGAAGYGIAILDGENEIYRRSLADERREPGPADQGPGVDLEGVTWRVRVWPGPALMAQARSSLLPQVVLGTGLLMALLMALTVQLTQTATLRAQESEPDSRTLE